MHGNGLTSAPTNYASLLFEPGLHTTAQESNSKHAPLATQTDKMCCGGNQLMRILGLALIPRRALESDRRIGYGIVIRNNAKQRWR
jgi:hypothetical protein